MLSRNDYIRKSFQEIIEAKNNKNISVFIGAGISKLSGSLTWTELIDEMLDDLGIIKIEDKEAFKKNYTSMAIAQMYEGKFGTNTYEKFINDKLGIKLTENEFLKKIIKELKPQNFITTNYDEVIENELTDLGRINNYNIIKEDRDFSKSKVNKKIVKMHGSLDKNNMVLKETDYLEYSENFKLIETTVKSIIAGNKVIFFGYSLQDNNVKQIINWIKNLTKDSTNMPILFLVNRPETRKDEETGELILEFNQLSDDEIKYYKKIGVDVIQFHELEEVFSKEIYIEKIKSSQNFEYAYMTFFEYLNYVEKVRYMTAHEKIKSLYDELIEIDKDKYIRLEDCIEIFKKYGFIMFQRIIKIDNTELITTIKDYMKKDDNSNEKNMMKFITKFIYERAGRFKDKEISNLISKVYNIENGIRYGNNHIEILACEEQEENQIREYLRKAYCNFYNGNIEDAMDLYKEIMKISRNRNDIFFYVIAVVNEYVCKKATYRDTNPKELYEILENLPEEFRNKYGFINELINFKIQNKQIKYYQHLTKYYNEMYTNKNISRLGNSEFIELIDLYNCIKENYLLIDVFSNIRNIFVTFTEGEIVRYLYKSKYKITDNEGALFGIENFDQSSYIEQEKLIWALEYCDLSFIEDNFTIFTDYKLGDKQSEDVIVYALEYLKHLLEKREKTEYIVGTSVQSTITKVICFLQAFNINGKHLKELLELTLKIELLEAELLSYVINIIYKFKEKEEINTYIKIKDIFEELCYKAIKLGLYRKEKRVTLMVLDFIKNNDITIDKVRCSEIFSYYNIDKENYELFLQFYKYLSEDLKDEVLKYCKKILEENLNMGIISGIVMYGLPIDVSKYNELIEKYFEDDENWTNVHKSKNREVHDNSRNMTMKYIEYMMRKLTQKQKEIIVSKERMYAFYFDYKKFNYNDFEASYLLSATPNFILKVTEDEERKNKIITKIALAINETINQNDINRYMKILRMINTRDNKYYFI